MSKRSRNKHNKTLWLGDRINFSINEVNVTCISSIDGKIDEVRGYTMGEQVAVLFVA